MRTNAVIATAVATVALLAPAAPAAAAPPTTEWITFEATFYDDGLSDACGVDVWTTVSSFRIARTFEEGKNLMALTTVNAGLVATSEFGSYRFRDVGADILKQSPDGTITLSIIGQLPFDFKGVFTFDIDTGEVIKATHSTGEWQTERACAALTDG